jgi:hypothetical protein
VAGLLDFIKPCPVFHGRAFAPTASNAREARGLLFADGMACLETLSEKPAEFIDGMIPR